MGTQTWRKQKVVFIALIVGYCILQVDGQIGLTSCTETTTYTCNYLFNTICNLATGFCDCPAGYTNISNIACEYECGPLSGPDFGTVLTDNTTTGGIASYSCDSSYLIDGQSQRTCVEDNGWTGTAPTCVINDVKCPIDTDYKGTAWNDAFSTEVVNVTCDVGFTGHVTRECLSGGSWQLPVYDCIRGAVQNIANSVNALSSDSSTEDFSTVLADIQSITTQTTNVKEKITNGEMKILTKALNTLATIIPGQLVIIDSILDNFFASVDNLIDESNTYTWQSELDTTSAVQLVSAVDNYTKALCDNLQSGEARSIAKDNIALKAQTLSNSKIMLPDGTEDLDWLVSSKSKIELEPQAFNGVTDPIITTAVVYRNLSGILPNTYSENEGDGNSASEKTINGPVLAMTIPSQLSKELLSPISITFEHYQNDQTAPLCTYWEYESNVEGQWSNDGCEVITDGNDVTVCECTHLTNFAVLMSPMKEADESSWDLRIISIVCLSFSIICLVGTIVLHLVFWKQLGSKRTTMMLHLCVALVISYLVFLIGVNQTKRKKLCTAIAVFLHYIFLAVFGIMFVQGLQIAEAVTYVFKAKSDNLKRLLGAAWGLPFIIVGIAMMASTLEGYGNNKLCWLTSDSGLIWSFVGPAIVVTIFNTICLCLVLRAIFRARFMQIKPVGKRVRTSMWTLCVLLPLLGVTWIVGLFYIDVNTGFIQYIFAILNGLQGFFIFLFQCVLNKQMKMAMGMGMRESRVTRLSSKFTQEATIQT